MIMKICRLRTLICVFAMVLSCLGLEKSLMAQAEDLNVLTDWFEWSSAPGQLRRSLNREAQELLTARSKKVAALRSKADWERRQAEVRDALVRLMGPFPEKSPLNARITGTVQARGFRVEKVVFESMPRFYVTGCLFVPDNLKGKAPAILDVIGHTDVAFRAVSYQQLILNLVDKGFIVFAVDPVGQGERLQYYDPERGVSKVGGATAEHSYLGKQCFLTGSSAAHYFAWDGIRAIDYLVSRPEVDPGRIGVTGISGGGTQTSYISALDERVKAAAPSNYICGLSRLFESIGPQDAEQNLLGGVTAGIDHGDFLEVRAPKPTLVVATTRDFFSIQGARETVAEARRAFEALGSPSNLSIFEDDHGHGYTKKTREAIYAFFQRYLENPGSPEDRTLEPLSRADLTVTPTGQLIDSLGGETVFSLNKARAENQLGELRQKRSRPGEHLTEVRSEALRLSGYRAPTAIADTVFRGRYSRPGYSIEKYGLTLEDGTLLPFLLLKPDGIERPPALLYLRPEGKSAAAAPGGAAEILVKQGWAVMLPDLSGMGELGGTDETEAFLALQMSRSVVAIRAAEIVSCLRHLRTRDDVDGKSVSLVAKGEMALPVLQATAVETDVRQVALMEPPLSVGSTATSHYYSSSVGSLIGGMVGVYDLADLEALIAPRRLLILNPKDPLSRPAPASAIQEELAVVRNVYGPGDGLKVEVVPGFEPLENTVASWLRK